MGDEHFPGLPKQLLAERLARWGLTFSWRKRMGLWFGRWRWILLARHFRCWKYRWAVVKVLWGSNSNSHKPFLSHQAYSMTLLRRNSGLAFVFRCSPDGRHDLLGWILVCRTHFPALVRMELSQVLVRLINSGETAESPRCWCHASISLCGTLFNSLDKMPIFSGA